MLKLFPKLRTEYINALIVFTLFVLVIIFVIPPSQALESDPTYIYTLQGQQIVFVDTSRITLQNGTVIVPNIANMSLYGSQITKTQVTYIEPTSGFKRPGYTFNPNMSVEYPEWDPGNATRINQGDCVTLGETIDIAGDGWYTGYLSYYGRYYDDYSYGYNISVVAIMPVKSRNLSSLYIDPGYFYQYPGWWYVYYPYQAEESHVYLHGYDRLFYVGDSCTMPNLTIAQRDIINVTLLYRMREASLSALPVKTEFNADYIVSRNLTTVLPAPEDSHAWLFGRTVSLLDFPLASSQLILNAAQTINWEPGIYDAILIQKDSIGIYEQSHDAVSQTIISPFSTVRPIYIGDSQPQLVKDTLVSLINSSFKRDYTDYSISLQDPMIQVVKMNQWQGLNNETLITLAGYTNSNPGDALAVSMDLGKLGAKAHTWNISVIGSLSEYRTWNTTFLFNIQGEAKGPHEFTISSQNGATMTFPFYVYRELAPHYIPENYLQYVNNSPFIPPVIETVMVPVPGPVQYVNVTVTPSQESVNEAQYNAIVHLAMIIGGIVATTVVTLLIARFVYLGWRRRRWFRP